jgi:hypothetical protein
MSTGDRWTVSFNGAPIQLHAALWVRQAAKLLPDDSRLPGRLLDPVPTLNLDLDAELWYQWWRALLRVPDVRWSLRDRWPLAPGGLRSALDSVGDAPLTWANDLSQLRDPYRQPRYRLPVEPALAELRREGAGRTWLETRVYGLAVEGSWIQVEPESSLILASWSSLGHAHDWLTGSLRDTVRPLAS